nr:hypothetical protein Iba_chr10eCG8750 [Ipomoea batatas]
MRRVRTTRLFGKTVLRTNSGLYTGQLEQIRLPPRIQRDWWHIFGHLTLKCVADSIHLPSTAQDSHNALKGDGIDSVAALVESNLNLLRINGKLQRHSLQLSMIYDSSLWVLQDKRVVPLVSTFIKVRSLSLAHETLSKQSAVTGVEALARERLLMRLLSNMGNDQEAGRCEDVLNLESEATDRIGRNSHGKLQNMSSGTLRQDGTMKEHQWLVIEEWGLIRGPNRCWPCPQPQ